MRLIRAAALAAAMVISVLHTATAEEPAAPDDVQGSRLKIATSPLPPNAGIVFTREIDGKRDLMVGRISDGSVEKLFDTPEIDERSPHWSQAAGLLLFEASTAEGTQLILYDPTNGERRLAHETANPIHNYWGSWAPNGKHFAFTLPTDLPEGRRGVREYDIASGTHQRLGSATFTMEFLRADYAPDSRVAVAQRRGGDLFKQQLWLIQTGERARQITSPTDRYDHSPNFTRDGEWVVFASRVGDAPNRLNLIRPDGTDRRPFHYKQGGDERSPVASPTRDEIAFTSRRTGAPDIYLADIDGDAMRNLSRSPNRSEKNLVWSDDGNRLAYQMNSPGDPGGPTGRVAVMDRSSEILFESRGRDPSFMPVFR